MAHSRSLGTTMVPLNNLKHDGSHEKDDIFQRIVKDDILGKVNNSLTRMPIKKIITGFFKRIGNAVNHISDLNPRHTAHICKLIKTGGRPAVEVYWNPLAPRGGAYVSPDTEATLAAYRFLDIKIVPVRILKPIFRPIEEGAVWVRSPFQEPAKIVRCIPSNQENYTGFFEVANFDCISALEWLSNKSTNLLDSIKLFHSPSENNIHYHQMLHIVLQRHVQSIRSIISLLNIGNVDHAAFFIRSAYEAYLNFYVDWLSPDFFGPKIYYISKRSGDPETFPAVDHVENFISFTQKSRQKAALSNLGERFYDCIYKPISEIIHQPYRYVVAEKEDFSIEMNDIVNIDAIKEVMNVLTYALTMRIANEVGRAF